MSAALFLRLSSIRAFKVESAQRECLRLQAVLVQREQALRTALQAQALQVASRDKRAERWRADRLALATFDTQACDCHRAEMARCELRISEATALVREQRAAFAQAANALHTAKDALARRRVELNKAETGLTQFRTQDNRRDEAREEDELDELGALRHRSHVLELRT